MKKKKNDKQLEKLRIQRKISRDLQLESGIKHRPAVFVNKKKYNRKNKKWVKEID